MKTFSIDLQTHLDSGATTLSYCWRIDRKDGTTLGFTEHDEDLTFDSVTYKASSGFQATAIQSSLGMNVDNLDVSGGISSDAITEGDLIAGRYDDAAVTLYYVNWKDVSMRAIVATGFIGEVKKHGIAFTAELRGLTTKLNQKLGRLYQRTCDAVFGDARCGFDKATVTDPGAVEATLTPRSFTASGTALEARASDFHSRGVVTWLTGDNEGTAYDVKVHAAGSPYPIIELWTPTAFAIQAGDTFTIIAGCLQTIKECRDKFDNVVNFQGYAFMPGNDALLRSPTQGGANQDGGPAVDPFGELGI